MEIDPTIRDMYTLFQLGGYDTQTWPFHHHQMEDDHRHWCKHKQRKGTGSERKKFQLPHWKDLVHGFRSPNLNWTICKGETLSNNKTGVPSWSCISNFAVWRQCRWGGRNASGMSFGDFRRWSALLRWIRVRVCSMP